MGPCSDQEKPEGPKAPRTCAHTHTDAHTPSEYTLRLAHRLALTFMSTITARGLGVQAIRGLRLSEHLPKCGQMFSGLAHRGVVLHIINLFSSFFTLSEYSK